MTTIKQTIFPNDTHTHVKKAYCTTISKLGLKEQADIMHAGFFILVRTRKSTVAVSTNHSKAVHHQTDLLMDNSLW